MNSKELLNRNPLILAKRVTNLVVLKQQQRDGPGRGFPPVVDELARLLGFAVFNRHGYTAPWDARDDGFEQVAIYRGTLLQARRVNNESRSRSKTPGRCFWISPFLAQGGGSILSPPFSFGPTPSRTGSLPVASDFTGYSGCFYR
ncbi:hypothetical protein PG988_016232 [Apiospora saccharicola]